MASRENQSGLKRAAHGAKDFIVALLSFFFLAIVAAVVFNWIVADRHKAYVTYSVRAGCSNSAVQRPISVTIDNRASKAITRMGFSVTATHKSTGDTGYLSRPGGIRECYWGDLLPIKPGETQTVCCDANIAWGVPFATSDFYWRITSATYWFDGHMTRW